MSEEKDPPLPRRHQVDLRESSESWCAVHPDDPKKGSGQTRRALGSAFASTRDRARPASKTPASSRTT